MIWFPVQPLIKFGWVTSHISMGSLAAARYSAHKSFFIGNFKVEKLSYLGAYFLLDCLLSHGILRLHTLLFLLNNFIDELVFV